MKNTRGILFKCALWLILASVATSCISYKKNLILKKDSEFFPNAELNTPVQAYKLQTNDVVYVEIERLYMGDEAYTIANHLKSGLNAQMMNPYIVGYPIGMDGALQLPLVGEIQAEGMTG